MLALTVSSRQKTYLQISSFTCLDVLREVRAFVLEGSPFAAQYIAVFSVSDFTQKRFDSFMIFKRQFISELYFLSGQRLYRKKLM